MHTSKPFLQVITLVALVSGPISLAAQSESSAVKQFNIAAQPLDSALLEFSEQAELQLVVAAKSLQGIDTSGFKGEGTAEIVLTALLGETNLGFKTVGATITVVNGSAGDRQADEQSSRDPDEPSATESKDSAPRSQPADNRKLPGEEGAEEPDDPLELAVQTVTGSRLTRNASEIPTQIIVLTSENLRNTGAPTLEQALRQLPQNINGTTEFGGSRLYSVSDKSGRLLGSSNINGASTINLRGLGESATLILVNGKRAGDSGMMGGFTDISEFPLSIVDRVEIQLDGASAVYGSDAIGGVVNVILKDDFDFRRVSLRRTGRAGGGHTEDNASVVLGTKWDTGKVMLNFDLYRSSHQNVSTTDLLGLGVHLYGYPGNVRGRRGTPLKPREISKSLTGAAIAADAIGEDETVTRVLIPTDQDGTDLTLDDFLASANTYRTNEDTQRDISVTPRSDRHYLRVAVDQKIFEGVDLSAAITYAKRKTGNRSGPALGNVKFDVAEENPYNPFGTDVSVDLDMADVFGTREVSGERESWSVDLDFSGEISDRWDWILRSRWANRESLAETRNFIDFGVLSDLTNSDRTDPTEALNVFGNTFLTDGNNADVLASADYQHPLQRSGTDNRLLSSEFVVRGSLFTLPGGPVRAVLGGEWREQSVDVEYGNTYARIITLGSPIGVDALTNGFSEKGTRHVRAAFAEAFVPIVSKANVLAGIHDLSFSLRGRSEDASGSSSAGADTNTRYDSNVWGAGLVYRPIRAIKFRANESTSFRAPDIPHALLSRVVSQGFLFDLRNGGFEIARPDNISGGNPNLLPEESESTTVGLEFDLSLLKLPYPLKGLNGLSFSVDYHETLFTNRIASLNIFGALFLLDTTYEIFKFQYELDEEGRVKSFDSRPVNIAYVETRGMDYGMTYDFGFDDHEFRFFANVATTDEYLEDINTFDSEEAQDKVGVTIPDTQFLAGLAWGYEGIDLTLNARTSSGVRYTYVDAPGLEPPDNEIVQINVKTKPPTVVDFRGTVDVGETWCSGACFGEGLRVSFGLNNIFGSRMKTELDPEPDAGHLGIPRNTISTGGRRYYVEVSKEF